MDILKNLFYGFPDLWGGGVAHSVLILALVITLGLSLGKLRVKGVSLGLAWILFIGLIFGHFSLNLDEHLLHFLKEFGLITRRIRITKPGINGKSISQLQIRSSLGANITRVNRNGVDLIATPQLKLQLGDRVTVVGTELAIAHTEKVLGNQMKRLNYPNLIPIFLGIMLGCIVANIPFFIPGINENLRLGLTGGPLVVAILIGYFGPKYNLVTYNTISANLMLREIGICIFLACVGLGTGEQFIQTVASESGMTWILYGIAITMIPIIVGGIIGRYVFHINYYTLLGVLAGANTNPSALAYVREQTSADAPSVGYANVYPFAMFLRIVTIQIIIFVFG